MVVSIVHMSSLSHDSTPQLAADHLSPFSHLSLTFLEGEKQSRLLGVSRLLPVAEGCVIVNVKVVSCNVYNGDYKRKGDWLAQ